jgi:membrane dipeptidase
MPFIIDAHEDLACNALGNQRDYLQPVSVTRQREVSTRYPEAYGDCLVGWPEFQKGQIGLVFGTLFATPRQYLRYEWDNQSFSNEREANTLALRQVDYYHRLTGENPSAFRLVRDATSLKDTVTAWQTPAQHPALTHSVGIVILMEGADGIRSKEDLENFWELGVRMIGPVWAGNRFCGGTRAPGPFTAEGKHLLKEMSEVGYTLDVSHMSEEPLLQALDLYEGNIIASHANCKVLPGPVSYQRHLTDEAIRGLVGRDAVIGVIPFNRFLKADWQDGDLRSTVPLGKLVDHIDHICQLAGNALHAGLGSDFDGGFGLQSTPEGIDTIADLQQVESLLNERGYNDEQVAAIFHGNWQHHLEKSLPA